MPYFLLIRNLYDLIDQSPGGTWHAITHRFYTGRDALSAYNLGFLTNSDCEESLEILIQPRFGADTVTPEDRQCHDTPIRVACSQSSTHLIFTRIKHSVIPKYRVTFSE